MCEEFACERLKICPGDIKQRIADGLGSVLAVLGHNSCGTFPFKTLIEASNPTSALPVLFSSLQYTSPEVVPLFRTGVVTNYLDDLNCVEYWYGLEAPYGPGPLQNRLCRKCEDISYSLDPSTGHWRRTNYVSPFKSVPGVCLRVTDIGPTFPKYISVNRLNDDGTDTHTPLGEMDVATACQLSGDGQVFFVRDAIGWKRHRDAKTWVAIGRPDPESELHTSFDGQSFVQSNRRSPEYHYTIGSSRLKTKTLAADESEEDAVLSAVLGNTIFIARGKKLYSVGPLDLEQIVFKLADASAGVIVGLWADVKTLWLTTDKSTFMSSDGVWTWTEMKNMFAVGPGLFTKPNDGQIWTNSDDSFVEAVGFPLRLTNGGLLYSDINNWANAYQDRTKDDKYSTVEATDRAVLSPNGEYLLTQDDGVLTLYLNVWNSASFSTWCKKAGNDCQAAYAQYCLEFKGDPGCKTSTPDGPYDPSDPGGPGSKPDDTKEGFPTWAIVLITIAGLGLIGALLRVWLRKRKSKPVMLVTP